ncbi:nucleotidyl transferase AbiEii/AbiGii toxin family protein [Olsenella phocaeensis]|uniref:nucleotidyl transferase AbiEii/AbiGii toxin family protein n=1 Tax=Olsenella phocaeensis TaxID=1852385 RepID=UPI0009302C65|nr:nucleotidyl transferase AbiEii/AbiGii toxin family protein [Olsenella phocaeensis]
MDFVYSTPAAFDRAIKKAVRESGTNPGEGYRQALRDRFLCRVFADANETFVLKGGSGLLARIPDARATRDLDFATSL